MLFLSQYTDNVTMSKLLHNCTRFDMSESRQALYFFLFFHRMLIYINVSRILHISTTCDSCRRTELFCTRFSIIFLQNTENYKYEQNTTFSTICDLYRRVEVFYRGYLFLSQYIGQNEQTIKRFYKIWVTSKSWYAMLLFSHFCQSMLKNKITMSRQQHNITSYDSYYALYLVSNFWNSVLKIISNSRLPHLSSACYRYQRVQIGFLFLS